MHEAIVRFLCGGIVVSTFALFGDVLKPKSYAGLFGAAPSVALATLGLAVHHHGTGYASLEAKFMALGAIAFFIYASVASHLLMRQKRGALPVTVVALVVWLGAALGLERLLER
jgi:hypothetical protein